MVPGSERIVYRGSTGDHPLEVSGEGSLLSLRFGGDERQSCVDIDCPHKLQLAYTRWMMTALLLHPAPSRFLLCGLGGGAIAHFLHHHHPDGQQDIVEKEAKVIRVAKKYFGLPQTEQITLYHQDAVDFICNHPPNTAYHIAFIDLFSQDAMAPPVYVADFYRGIFDLLDAQGVIAVNLWNGNTELFQNCLHAIRKSCANRVMELAVKKRSNAIVFGFRDNDPRQVIKKARKQLPALEARYQLPFHKYFKKLRRTNRRNLFA
ncbi:MAG: hypothetical protein CSB34_03930 [Desulfobulbus propionicus]|nr:MAG: hypothetical protein CSB34_03930 [Desulfobulbus propionicus]